MVVRSVHNPKYTTETNAYPVVLWRQLCRVSTGQGKDISKDQFAAIR